MTEFNVDRVLEMMTAMREGRDYSYEAPPMRDSFGSPGITLSFVTESIHLEMDDDDRGDPVYPFIDAPNTARELGIALLMWANANEGVSFTPDQMFELTKLLGWVKPKPERHTINKSRAEWYERNIQFMTFETMKRNWEDLKREERTYKGLDPNLNDCRRAMNYLWHAMKEIKPDIKQCKKCYFIDSDPHFCK